MTILALVTGVDLGAAFAEWLGKRLEERDLGNNQFAEYVGVGKNTVSAWRRGRSDPGPANCRKVAEYFGRPPDEVLALVGHRPTGLGESRLVALQAQISSIQQRMTETADQMTRTAEQMAEQRTLLAELLGEVRRLSREQPEPDDRLRLLAHGGVRPDPEAQSPG